MPAKQAAIPTLGPYNSKQPATQVSSSICVVQAWQYAGNQCAFGASQDSVSPSRQYLMHFFEAYPEAQEVMAAVEEAWQMGTLEVWLLPPAAINGCKQAPQVCRLHHHKWRWLMLRVQHKFCRSECSLCSQGLSLLMVALF